MFFFFLEAKITPKYHKHFEKSDDLNKKQKKFQPGTVDFSLVFHSVTKKVKRGNLTSLHFSFTWRGDIMNLQIFFICFAGSA